MLNRFGAILAGFGALAVLYQVFREETFAEEDKTDSTFLQGNLDTITRNIASNAIFFRHHERQKKRRKMVAHVATILFVAEIFHGWGDLFLNPVCSAPTESLSH